MVAQSQDLWNLVWGTPQVDPTDLARAVEDQVGTNGLDYRTRLLVRDSTEALRSYWGDARFGDWLRQSPARVRIEQIRQEDFEKAGFPTLRERLVEKTNPEMVRQFLRELGGHLNRPTKVFVGGSIALILPGLLSRATIDIDVVDEVPAELRAQHSLLQTLKERYGFVIAHFQRHYLPMGWENRVHFYESFGELRVYLLDPMDVFLSKLVIIRTKDLDDMRMIAQRLSKEALVAQLKANCSSMVAAQDLRQRAEKNWYILFGEPLPQ